jgi:hypothetical protein
MIKFIWIILATIFLLISSIVTYADPYLDATINSQPIINQSYFGTHFHRLVLTKNEVDKYKLSVWPIQLIGSIRLWDARTRWADIAPYRGQWDFKRMDTYIKQAAINGATVIYTLGSPPQWASARPLEKCSYGFGCSAEPANMGDWEEYVRTVAQRYRGKIAIYELWNEPDFSDIPNDRHDRPGFYKGNVANMVEMARIARRVLDEEDPNAKLSTPGFVNGPHRLEMFLSAGGKQYVQAISYHFYARNSSEMANKLVDVRAVMQRQSVANLPLMNTEAGLEVVAPNKPQTGFAVYSQAEGAGKLAQYFILGAAAGLQQYYHYVWDNAHMGMETPQGEKLPPYDAYVKTRSWLLNSKMLGCESIVPNGVKCLAENAGKRFLYVWAVKSGNYTVPLPSGYRVATIEKLNDTAPQSRISNANSLNLELGDAPIRVMLKTK